MRDDIPKRLMLTAREFVRNHNRYYKAKMRSEERVETFKGGEQEGVENVRAEKIIKLDHKM